ncbi:putative sulfate transporter, partial [Trichostrongylus colubriformis]
VLVAVLGLDFVTTYFSDELVAGFTTGASLHVFITQLKDVFGMPGLPRRDGIGNALFKIYDLCVGLPRTNLVTLGLSALTILLLLLGKYVFNPFLKKRLRCPVPFPMELLVVVLGTLISQFAHLQTNFGVKTVGKIPEG